MPVGAERYALGDEQIIPRRRRLNPRRFARRFEAGVRLSLFKSLDIWSRELIHRRVVLNILLKTVLSDIKVLLSD